MERGGTIGTRGPESPSRILRLYAPAPVIKSETTEPGLAGFAVELMLPSSFSAASCPLRVNNPGEAGATGSLNPANRFHRVVHGQQRERIVRCHVKRDYGVDLFGVRVEDRRRLPVERYAQVWSGCETLPKQADNFARCDGSIGSGTVSASRQ